MRSGFRHLGSNNRLSVSSALNVNHSFGVCVQTTVVRKTAKIQYLRTYITSTTFLSFLVHRNFVNIIFSVKHRRLPVRYSMLFEAFARNPNGHDCVRAKFGFGFKSTTRCRRFESSECRRFKATFFLSCSLPAFDFFGMTHGTDDC
jgi:hypothetical protein